jgi:hypothetical protein
MSDDTYTPRPITAPVSPIANTLFEAASRGQLVVCGGAGLSRGQPSDLPSGAQLGRRLDRRLTELVEGYVPPPDPENLIAVADSGAQLTGGEEALRAEVLRLADFLGAAPNPGHAVLAELLCEGAIDCLLLWNWDDCVERVAISPERLQVAHSREDLSNLVQPAIAKIHGCATRRSTLLITSEHLVSPPLWTDGAFAERLRGKTVVFVGIGDIADYAKRRLAQLHAQFPDLDVWIVSPDIASSWDDSQWAELFPDLAPERKIALTADDFLDQISRRWIRDLLDRLDHTASQLVQPAVAESLEQLLRALGAPGGPAFIRWARWAAVAPRIGTSVLRWTAFDELLLAAAVIADEKGVVSLVARSQAGLELDGERIEALVADGIQGAAHIRAHAQRRAEQLAGQGTIGDRATFLVAGSIIGALDDDDDRDLDVAVGRAAADDVFDGAGSVRLKFLRAGEAVKRAA